MSDSGMHLRSLQWHPGVANELQRVQKQQGTQSSAVAEGMATSSADGDCPHRAQPAAFCRHGFARGHIG